MKELERLTMPAGGASKARSLKAEEIEHLLLQGKVTPLEQIPHVHICGYENEPRRYGKGRLGDGGGY